MMKKEHGIQAVSVEGMDSGRWVLLDFGDIVVHVFDEPLRSFYDLDGLWSDAPRIELEGGTTSNPEERFLQE